MNEHFLSNILLNNLEVGVSTTGENEDWNQRRFQEIEAKGFEKHDRSNCSHYLKG